MKIFIIILIVAIAAYLLSLIDMYTQLARYKNYWLRNNEKVVVTKPIYFALGDSAAQGVGATHPSRSYPGVIQQGMNENGRDVQLVNLSKSGAKVRDVIDTQLPELERYPVDPNAVVTIEIGANDMVSFEPKKFEADMDELMTKLPSQTLISDIPYFGQSRLKNKQPNVVEANKIMYKLAQKHGYKLVPLHEKMEKNGGIRTFAPDWFHPSNYAYRENWAAVFLERINADTKATF